MNIFFKLIFNINESDESMCDAKIILLGNVQVFAAVTVINL